MANVGDKLIVEVKEVASWGKGCEPIYKLKGFVGTFTPNTVDALPSCETVYDTGYKVDYAPCEECTNPDTYGEICVKCGVCGRKFDKEGRLIVDE